MAILTFVLRNIWDEGHAIHPINHTIMDAWSPVNTRRWIHSANGHPSGQMDYELWTRERQTRLGFSFPYVLTHRVSVLVTASVRVRYSLDFRKLPAIKHDTTRSSAGAPCMSLCPAIMLRNAERNRAAFFVCFFALVVLLLRSWLNPYSLDDEEYGIIVGIVCFLLGQK